MRRFFCASLTIGPCPKSIWASPLLADLCCKLHHALTGTSKAKAVVEFAVGSLATQARLKAFCDDGFVVDVDAFA